MHLRGHSEFAKMAVTAFLGLSVWEELDPAASAALEPGSVGPSAEAPTLAPGLSGLRKAPAPMPRISPVPPAGGGSQLVFNGHLPNPVPHEPCPVHTTTLQGEWSSSHVVGEDTKAQRG